MIAGQLFFFVGYAIKLFVLLKTGRIFRRHFSPLLLDGLQGYIEGVGRRNGNIGDGAMYVALVGMKLPKTLMGNGACQTGNGQTIVDVVTIQADKRTTWAA